MSHRLKYIALEWTIFNSEINAANIRKSIGMFIGDLHIFTSLLLESLISQTMVMKRITDLENASLVIKNVLSVSLLNNNGVTIISVRSASSIILLQYFLILKQSNGVRHNPLME